MAHCLVVLLVALMAVLTVWLRVSRLVLKMDDTMVSNWDSLRVKLKAAPMEQ